MVSALRPIVDLTFLDGGGEARALLREHDWSATAIGVPEKWPATLRALVQVMLGSSQPMFVAWGPERSLLHNEPYIDVLANKHPALGRDFLDVWSEIRADLEPLVARAYAGEATRMDDIELVMERKGYPERTHWAYSYTPVRDEDGRVGGFLCACQEVTHRVLAERRQAFRLRLEDRFRTIGGGPRAVMDAAVEELGRHLGASRVGYSEVRADDRTLDFHACYADGVAPILGSHLMDDFGPETIARQRQGETAVTPDVRTDPQQVLETWEAIDTRAFVSVPLVRDGRFRASLYVNHRLPHRWTADEVALIEEVAERTWSAVERARAETARDRAAQLNAAQGRVLELAVRDAPLRETLDAIVATVEDLSTARVLASILLLDPDGFHLRHGAAPSLPAAYNEAIDGIAVGPSVGSCGSAVHLGAPVFVANIASDPLWADFRDLALEYGLRACWSIPIRSAQDTVLGTFAMYYREPREPQPADLELVDFVVRTAGLVIERARTEEAMRRSEARYRQIVEGAEDFAIVTLDAAGDITGWNSGAERLIGFAPGEAIGQSGAMIFTPEDRARETPDDEMRRAREHGRAINERWHLRKDGGRFWGSGLLIPLAAGHGGYLKMFRDRTAEHEAEAERARLATRFGVALAVAKLGAFEWAVQTGAVQLDERAREILGLSGTGEVSAQDIFDRIHPDDLPRVLAEALQSQKNMSRLETEYRVLHADGSVRLVRSINDAIAGENGSVERLLGVFDDVTDNRRAEAALRESEERMRLATENAEVGFWDVDEVEQVLHWPPIVKAMFGIAADASVSMADFFAGLHPEDAPATAAAYAAAADPARRGLYDVEYRTIGKQDGVVRWVAAKGRGVFDASGRCLRVTGTAVDVTARKLMEEQLRELNERLEQRVAETSADLDRVWRNAGDLLLVVDASAVVRRINPAATRILGWSEAEMIGRSMLELLHPEDMQASLAALADASKEPLAAFENRLVTRSGEVRTISWTTAPEQSFIYAYGRDVTDARAREAELEAAQEALRQSQKMEAMGQLTGGVAHDFNNLLTPIVGSLDMLQRKGLGGEREQRLIAGAIQSADRAKTLVQRLLAFARRQPLQPIAVDIAQLIVGMGELVESTTGPQIRVVVEAAPDLPPAKADSNQLEMALLNLSVNARDAMPEGGTLRITAVAETVGAGHRAKLRPGDYVRLSVADTGVGMSEATLARAVEPFFSTKGVGKGTGLGLSMVHGLASQLGGALTIQSRQGLGTNIELWLPVTAAPVEASRLTSQDPTTAAQKGRVLLVDDEELVRMSTADMLAELGFVVVEAGSGEEALQLIEREEPFDLVLTDHLMPGMTGTDLARAIQSSGRSMPVMLVSGYAEREGIDADLPRLTKPFRRDDLAASLAQWAAS